MHQLDWPTGYVMAAALSLLIGGVRRRSHAGAGDFYGCAHYVSAHFDRGGADRNRGVRNRRHRAAVCQTGDQHGGYCD